MCVRRASSARAACAVVRRTHANHRRLTGRRLEYNDPSSATAVRCSDRDIAADAPPCRCRATAAAVVEAAIVWRGVRADGWAEASERARARARRVRYCLSHVRRQNLRASSSSPPPVRCLGGRCETRTSIESSLTKNGETIRLEKKKNMEKKNNIKRAGNDEWSVRVATVLLSIRVTVSVDRRAMRVRQRSSRGSCYTRETSRVANACGTSDGRRTLYETHARTAAHHQCAGRSPPPPTLPPSPPPP